jgi:SAM-dependent methyltransferase
MTTAPLLAPGHELLDRPDADSALVASSLHHIARANWWFGGWWAVRHGLGRLLDGAPAGTAVTLLDVGTGKGDLPRRAVRWGAGRGLTILPFGIDRHPTAAALADQLGVPSAVACAGTLPFGPASVDLIVASQLIHHLAPDAIIAFARAATAIARRGVILADLRRSRLAQAGFWVGSRLLGFDRATRDDGITSVRRGFTDIELADLLRRAGVPARIERTPGFRLVATWRGAAAA